MNLHRVAGSQGGGFSPPHPGEHDVGSPLFKGETDLAGMSAWLEGGRGRGWSHGDEQAPARDSWALSSAEGARGGE